MQALPYNPTPVQQIHHELLENTGVSLFVKREDLNHPFVTGNKWWKLKNNLEQAQLEQKTTLLTFGGAYSNHIYATAAAAHGLNLNSIGIIRGEETKPLNPTLSFAAEHGMQLHYISREDYRRKNEPAFLEELRQRFGNIYIVPEGGSNTLAVKGCEEFAKSLPTNMHTICLPVGTGGTIAGIINGLPADRNILGFSSLKGGDFLYDDVKQWLHNKEAANWQLENRYHFGGYAKHTPGLISFTQEFARTTGIMLDIVYTAKMMFGIFDLIKQQHFPAGSRILAIHTGGLQGNPAYL
jgi:1-aminocyclopropane-1-carboxylate deaminase